MSLLVAVLLVVQFATMKRIAALWLLQLPSTIAHELSHWLVALVLGCRPSRLSLWPKRLDDKTWQLGAVTFTPGTFTAGFVALAPVWVLGTATYWILWLRPEADPGTEFLAGLAGGITAWGCLPSSTDVSIALRYPAGTALLGCICYAVLA